MCGGCFRRCRSGGFLGTGFWDVGFAGAGFVAVVFVEAGFTGP